MRKLRKLLVFLIAGCLFLGMPQNSRSEVVIPELGSPVTDVTGTLSSEQISSLESELLDLRNSKGSQIVALIVPSTNPESIEQFGIRVAEKWKIGRKGIGDGVILIVALNDHRVRIEVGYGLEGALPDAISKRIIEEQILPNFKRNDYFGGIQAGIASIIKVVEGEPLPAYTPSEYSDNSQINYLQAFLLLLFGGHFVASLISAFGGGKIAAPLSGVMVSLVGLLFLSWLPAILCGIGVAILVGSGMLSGVGRFGGSGWSSGGRGWSGGGSGGGFSGGGGTFGGGGASGSW